ncbi:MAG TPA: hypothetical protein VGK87_11510, partial [Anaerolineae bacterium]
IVDPPSLRATLPLTGTLVLPQVEIGGGQPATHTLILPLVNDSSEASTLRAAGRARFIETLILPMVRNDGNQRGLMAGMNRFTDTLILPLVMVSGALQQAAIEMKQKTTCADVIQNDGFEAQPSWRPWVGVANLAYNRNAEPFITQARAHSGTQSARIGSPALGNYWSEVIQTVELPLRTSSITLTYWRYLDVPKPGSANFVDSFTAGIETEQGLQIVPPQPIDSKSASRGAWVQSQLVVPNAAAWSGKRIWVSFKGRTGARYPATLYIDDVQMKVCAVK